MSMAFEGTVGLVKSMASVFCRFGEGSIWSCEVFEVDTRLRPDTTKSAEGTGGFLLDRMVTVAQMVRYREVREVRI
jgi:hypothetical protein